MIDNEKYQKELIRMWDSMRNSHFKGKETCLGVKCEECPLYQFADCSLSINLLDIYNIVEKWLKEHPQKEHVDIVRKMPNKRPLKKHKISQLEYDILKYFSDNTRYMYITRSKNGFLCLFYKKPEKSPDDYWKGSGLGYMDALDELFQFVQWEDEEPKSIQEVLKKCEVIEDDD